jgi:hypothetical protein
VFPVTRHFFGTKSGKLRCTRTAKNDFVFGDSKNRLLEFKLIGFSNSVNGLPFLSTKQCALDIRCLGLTTDAVQNAVPLKFKFDLIRMEWKNANLLGSIDGRAPWALPKVRQRAMRNSEIGFGIGQFSAIVCHDLSFVLFQRLQTYILVIVTQTTHEYRSSFRGLINGQHYTVNKRKAKQLIQSSHVVLKKASW